MLVVVTVLAALAAPHARSLRGMVADELAELPAIGRPGPATGDRARAAQGAVAALAGPVDRPQLLGRGCVLAAPLSGRSGGGPLAGPAVGREPAAAAPVELSRLPDPATPRAALGRGHAAAPPERSVRQALAEARASRVK